MKFNEMINSGERVLVDFYADWCGPCRMMNPVINEVSKTHKVIKLNVDEEEGRNISMRYGISAIPTLIVFKDGQPEKTFVGLQKKETLIQALS